MTLLTQQPLELHSTSSADASLLPPPAKWAGQAGRYRVTPRASGSVYVAKVYDEAGRKLPRPVVRLVRGTACNCQAGLRRIPCKHIALSAFILHFLTCPCCHRNAHPGRDLRVWEHLDPNDPRRDMLGIECRNCTEQRRANGAFIHSAQHFWLNRDMTRAEWATAKAVIASYRRFEESQTQESQAAKGQTPKGQTQESQVTKGWAA